MSWWSRATRYALPHRRGLGFVLVLILLGVAFDVLKPWPLKLIVDYVLPGQPLPEPLDIWAQALPGGVLSLGLLAWLAGSTVLVFLGHQAALLAQSYLQAGIGTRMVYDLGGVLFDHMQRLSLRFHSRRQIGDLVRRVMGDTSCVRDLTIGVALPLLMSLTTLAVMFAVMWHLDPSLAMLSLLVAPVIALLIRWFNRPMTEHTYRYQQLEGQRMAVAEQTLTALPVVQAFGRESYENERLGSLSQRTLKAYLRTILCRLQFKVGVNTATAVGTALLMVIGGLHVLQGTLSVGDLLVFLSYLTSLYLPMRNLAYLSSSFASAAARAQRVFEVMDSEERVMEVANPRPLPAQSGHVRFENVSFGYEPGHPVLQTVSLEARPGDTIVLVGATGAGKSTLVSLIPRLFDPWEGRVAIGGVDVKCVKLSALREQIAVVLQEPFLLPLTVKENITYGCPDASWDQIEAAAVAANADEFIHRLPQGYDTVIGERGATLSGGQRQRLAIARALLKDAPILILDEPTAALDAGTEALLLEALERLMRGRTTFIIAHRLSTIRASDRIVVLEGGRIVETGTRGELLALDGYYKGFHDLQFAPRTGRV